MKDFTNIRTLRQLLALAMVLSATACGTIMTMMHGGPPRPPESEFGFGPRASHAGLYKVTLEPAVPLAKRKLQTVRVRILDADGHAVEGAQMLIGGGMPQHGHGLPTKPRMTRMVESGVYEIGGVRFSMGGWWEFKVLIKGKAGTDSVTFNLSL